LSAQDRLICSALRGCGDDQNDYYIGPRPMLDAVTMQSRGAAAARRPAVAPAQMSSSSANPQA
jgi:hypothetical protein